jgi:hypothetical protein
MIGSWLISTLMCAPAEEARGHEEVREPTTHATAAGLARAPWSVFQIAELLD